MVSQAHTLDELPAPSVRIDGEVLNTAQDNEDNKYLFLHLKKEEGYCYKLIHIDDIFDLDIKDVDEDTHISVLYSDAENTQFVVQHLNSKKVSIFEIWIEEGQV